MENWQKKSAEKRQIEGSKKRKAGAIQTMIVIFIIVIAFFGGLVLLNRGQSQSRSEGQSQAQAPAPVNNVSVVDGKQIIELTAKGGYTPKKSVAKAGIPTVLRVGTNGTFDCSSSIRIPALKLSQNLPTTGQTNIDLGQPQAGLFKGTCSMGMYPFEIEFQG